ncbi:hypothetical protein GCM10025774_24640 [Microbacterium kyungheense]
MPRSKAWQYSCGQCPSCHSWQFSGKRSVSAMFLILVITALSVWAFTSTITAVRSDGYRQVPTDRTRLP